MQCNIRLLFFHNQVIAKKIDPGSLIIDEMRVLLD